MLHRKLCNIRRVAMLHHRQAGARQDERRQDRARAKEFLEDIAPRETGRDKMVSVGHRC